MVNRRDDDRPSHENSAQSGGVRGVLRDPVGPKARGVYVRRRLAVLAVLVAIVVVVVLVLVKPGSRSGGHEAGDVELPGDLHSEVESSDAIPVCPSGRLRVTVMTDQDVYGAGEEPKLSLSVENTGTEPCTADLGTSTMKFEITSGDDQVWQSTDCQEDSETLLIILDPKKPETTEDLTWQRVRSSSDEGACDAPAPEVTGGGASYHVWATVAGVRSDSSKQIVLQ